jgi:hypothetical protein
MAFWRLLTDLPPKDFDCGGGAPHHHSFSVEAALVQSEAPVIEFVEDADLAARGAGSVITELMQFGHAAD